MAKITNTSRRTPYGLPLINRRHIEIAPGATVEFPDADYAAITNRKDISHLVSTGVLRVEGFAAPSDKQPDQTVTPHMIELTTNMIVADGTITAASATKPAKAKKA